MRRVVEGKRYYADLDVNVAGKTGTAQEDRNREKGISSSSQMESPF